MKAQRLFSNINLSEFTYGDYKRMYFIHPREIYTEKRNYDIFLYYVSGKSIQEVAEEFDLTRERTKQILNKIERRLKILIEFKNKYQLKP